MLRFVGLTVLCCSFAYGARAGAQPFVPAIAPNTSPIVVSTQPEKIAVRPKVAEQTLISVVFGATANGGNTKSYAGNLGGRIGYIREPHQLMLEGLGTMGGARQEGTLTKIEWTSKNMVGRVRYDLFLSRFDALFLAMAPRRDKFAGLDLRLQNQFGYLRNLFFVTDAHRLWSELGYDFTYDNFAFVERTATRDITAEVALANPTLVPEHATITQTIRTREPGGEPYVHSARVFLGYTNRLSPAANLSVGVEALLDFQDKENVRVNSLAELTSSITQTFKLGLQGRLLFDNVPVPGTRAYDLVAALQLVYTFDSLAGTVSGPCPPCDCSAQVQAARVECRAQEALRQITR